MRPGFLTIALALLASQGWSQKLRKPPASRFHLLDMPTAASMPCDVTGVDFNGEYIEWTEELVDNLARLNPDGTVTEYPIPFTVAAVPVSSLPVLGTDKPFVSCGLDQGLDKFTDMLFAINGFRNQLVAMNLSTNKIELHTAPNILGDVYPLSDLTPTPDAVWLTQSTGNALVKFNLLTHKFTTYKLPTPAALPIGVYYAAYDQQIYFLEFAASKIGILNPKTGKITELALPTALAGPMVIRAEIGENLYWASTLGGSIGEINMKTRKITAYKIPGVGRTPVEVCAEGDNVWFSLITQNELGRLTPSTGKFIFVDEPGDLVPGSPVSADPEIGDGIYCKTGSKRILFSQGVFNRAGYYQF